MAICSGGVSLDPAARVEALAILSADPAPQVAERAQALLLSQPPSAILEAISASNPAPALFLFCATQLADRPGVADALAKSPVCPGDTLALAVLHLSSDGVQAALYDLERLSSSPELIAAVVKLKNVTTAQQEILKELLRGPLQDFEIEEILEDAEADPSKRQTLFQRLSRMKVVERMQMALKGTREERVFLIRDPCKLVQTAVLQSPHITEPEIEGFAAMSTLNTEILRLIGKDKRYLKNYIIVRNLINNPKAPLDITLHLLSRLNSRDLKMLTMNRNVNDVLRKSAVNLNRDRMEQRAGS